MGDPYSAGAAGAPTAAAVVVEMSKGLMGIAVNNHQGSDIGGTLVDCSRLFVFMRSPVASVRIGS
jgi:hypothetical protein